MAKNKKKIPLGDLEPLSQSPFAGLGEQLGIQPQPSRPKEASKPKEDSQHPSNQSVLVRMEKRAKGKRVTCLYHYEGDAKALLKALKQRLGTGGTLADDHIELQGGQHVETVKAYLAQQNIKTR